MGEPDKIAEELFENYTNSSERPFREYKSKRTLFGLPLVHIIRSNYAAAVPLMRVAGARGISIGGRYGRVPLGSLPVATGIFAFGPKAKGIISIGNLSAGIISIGNISAGVFSLGNISAGIFTIGNIALAVLVSLGNIVAGALSAGNIALGYGAIGNVALGEYAIGNVVYGVSTFKISNLYSQLEAARQFIKGLGAPAPIRAFFGLADRIVMALRDPGSALPYKIAFVLVLIAAIWAIYAATNRLLRQKDKTDER